MKYVYVFSATLLLFVCGFIVYLDYSRVPHHQTTEEFLTETNEFLKQADQTIKYHEEFLKAHQSGQPSPRSDRCWLAHDCPERPLRD